MESIESFAKKTFLALKNPYHTVEAVYPNVIDSVTPSMERVGNACYVGCKQTSVIPGTLFEKLEQHGFLLHTRDKMSLGCKRKPCCSNFSKSVPGITEVCLQPT